MSPSEADRAPSALPAWAAGLPRVAVSRLASGGTALAVDVYDVDTIDKLIEAYDVRERAIASGEWRSKADSPTPA